jgi:hypothetical protein
MGQTGDCSFTALKEGKVDTLITNEPLEAKVFFKATTLYPGGKLSILRIRYFLLF